MTTVSSPDRESEKSTYNRFLLLVAGLGGLLYGIDIGIIDPALGYLGKAISMTEENKSIIVAAVLGGSMFASPPPAEAKYHRKRHFVAGFVRRGSTRSHMVQPFVDHAEALVPIMRNPE